MKRQYPLIISLLVVLLVALAVRELVPQEEQKLKKLPSNPPAAAINSFPAEFDKQQAMWLQWPTEIYNTSRPVYPVTIDIIKSFAPYIRVNLIVRSQDEINEVEGLLASEGYSGTNINYYPIDHFSIWARDVGPLFVKGPKGELKVADFGFNNYGRDGNGDYVGVESQVDRRAAVKLGLPVIKSALISEGGGIESNGRGTLMTTESVALIRNPGMSKAQIEAEYKRVLGVKKVIWLKKGLAEDDRITAGHINEIARFADPNTILLAQVLPGDRYANSITRESYDRMEENYQILRKATDQDGKPFRILRIPMPPTIYGRPNETGKVPVLSYLNYAVTNGAVLMQSYWQPGNSKALKSTEARVKKTLEKAFPGRRVMGIYTENINRWGGGIHCVTQHMPE